MVSLGLSVLGVQTWDQILPNFGFGGFFLVFHIFVVFMCVMSMHLCVSGLGGRFIGWAVLNPHSAVTIKTKGSIANYFLPYLRCLFSSCYTYKWY